MKYFSFLVYLVAFIACHDDHHTEPELPQGQWTESHPFKGIPRTEGSVLLSETSLMSAWGVLYLQLPRH